MHTEQSEAIYRVVDNRVLVLGIDEKYRHYMTEFEAEFLLPAVDVIATKLKVTEKDIPVEGYYTESPRLARYFKLMRALQDEDEASLPLVEKLPEFQQVWKVVNSPIFGSPHRGRTLLPQGRDPLSRALFETHLSQWKANKLTNTAYEIVMDTNDISLVGLAARLKDPIVITALRETMILYAEKEIGSIAPKLEYVWKVDDGFAEAANRFIEEFNGILPKDTYLSHGIAKAEPKNAGTFYGAYSENRILGRCANLGYDLSSPRQFYHWAITKQNAELTLDEFWDTELWTTDNYKSKQMQLGWKFLRDELTKQ